MNKRYYVYLLASKRNGTLYIGITSNLIKRVWEHKEKIMKGFTRKYSVDKLVYFEQYENPEDAIKREKRLKKYNREWKLELIEEKNPGWRDLYYELISGLPDQACPLNLIRGSGNDRGVESGNDRSVRCRNRPLKI